MIQALVTLQEIEDSHLAELVRSTPNVAFTGAVGRPRFEIPWEQLVLLIESKFTVPQIAEMIGVSVRTIHRRMSEYELSIHSEISDSDLDVIVGDVHKEFLMFGNKQIVGHLLSHGIRIQQSRVWESMRRVDPEVARGLNVIYRRVAAPRSLYHMDGHHKLIR